MLAVDDASARLCSCSSLQRSAVQSYPSAEHSSADSAVTILTKKCNLSIVVQLGWEFSLVIYPGSTPVGNATLVVANVLTCNKYSQK
jgi:hypothetical protein